jgi:hypothetical protein
MTNLASNSTGLFLKIFLVGVVCAIAAYVVKTRLVLIPMAITVGVYVAVVANNTFVYWYLT